ncbi:homoaconitate hydratase [candidate division LCP-89 bacterium B3_LCP]|uniref:Homoaconitate hydratase n=1 Tax=candidate division LCP-89 bacterium B3_LCP TaxID=2012998 RepID=A0A532V0Z0_UNCL8|nr:MAG: homoaconitate hydratase [candidate division LCP-89 bacterium B3_LCP]
MPQTVIEKIIAAHGGGNGRPGDIVWMDIDYRSARDFGGANVVGNLQDNYPDDPIGDLDRTFFTFDTNAPANTIGYAENQHICRTFAQEQCIKVFDVDRGIGTHTAIEEGLVWPGATGVGTDSHFNIMGAIGAFGQGMGDQDVAFIFKAGKTWFEVPPSMKVVFQGKLPSNCTPRDLTLKLVGTLGSSGALGKAVEIEGEAVDALDLSGRITLASMATETGAISYFIKPSQEIIDYCQKHSGRDNIEPVIPDADANYEDTIEIDVSNLEPQIACPPSPDNVVPVREVAGKKIHSVFLGSCTNGRIEDIRAAADILKDKKIAPGVMMKVVPATRQVYQQMLDEGLLNILFAAGAIVTAAGCGGCASGQVGMTGKGEVQLSTSNRNFRGKQGAGETYLCSPVTAALSAVGGEITYQK